VAAAILLVWLVLAGRRPRLTSREWLTVAVVGVAGTAGFHLCLVGGLALTTPAHAALLVNLTPLFATLLARFWLGERLGPRRLGGVLLAFGGLVLIVARGDLTGGTLLGDLLSVGAALAWTVYSVAGKPLLAVHPPLQITALAMILGTLPLLLVGGPALLAVPWRSLGAGAWLLLAYLSVGTIVVGYILWFWALARASTARVVAYSYLTPVIAAAISIALGQDAPSASLAVGALAVVAGVALTQSG
jgi:drug/metabolite transporter (DMT)-like permease